MGVAGVACPHCKSRLSAVVDSRDANGTRRRRRTCDECGGKFTTYEIEASKFALLKGVKVDELRVLSAGLLDALEQIKSLVDYD